MGPFQAQDLVQPAPRPRKLTWPFVHALCGLEHHVFKILSESPRFVSPAPYSQSICEDSSFGLFLPLTFNLSPSILPLGPP